MRKYIEFSILYVGATFFAEKEEVSLFSIPSLASNDVRLRAFHEFSERAWEVCNEMAGHVMGWIESGHWFVYVLECADGTLYCGITNDIQRRMKDHSSGRGAKYTRGRGPLRLARLELAESKGNALRRELRIKSMSRAEKLSLISKGPACSQSRKES